MVKEQLLLSDDMKWDEAYHKYSLFNIDEPTSQFIYKKSLAVVPQNGSQIEVDSYNDIFENNSGNSITTHRRD